MRHLVRYEADIAATPALKEVLLDILDTPVSPELLPAKDNGEIAQRTEDLVGPYELHDFYLYYVLRFGFGPAKIFRLARAAFAGREEYPDAVLYKWLRNFYWRFFAQQFKRSCLPDGPKIGSVTLSPRGDVADAQRCLRRPVAGRAGTAVPPEGCLSHEAEKNLWVNLLFAAVVLVIAGVLFYLRSAGQSGSTLGAELTYGDANTVQKISLDKDAVYDIDTGYLTVHIEVKDGAARFIDSPCPDHICESFGSTIWVK